MRALDHLGRLQLAQNKIHLWLVEKAGRRDAPVAAVVTRESCPACVRFRARQDAVKRRLTSVTPLLTFVHLDGTDIAVRDFALLNGARTVPSILIVDATGRVQPADTS
jgi:hypothetical protein